MKKFAIFATVLLSFFGVMAMSASAATYYVAKSGKDINLGTSASPWLTIGKAANTLVAGDTVYVMSGTYLEQVIPANSGSASGGYITFAAYPGQTVTVDGSRGLPSGQWGGIFNLLNRSYIQIIGFTIANVDGFGVLVQSTNNVKLLNNHTYNRLVSNQSRNVILPAK